MNENLFKTTFLYLNDFEFKEEFTVKHCIGATTITADYLDEMIVSDNIDHYQIFSFGSGVLLVYDLQGNVYSIVPSSGIIDVNGLLACFLKKESLGERTGYCAWWEFYRLTENDTDYDVNIKFSEESIELRYQNRKAIFNEMEFLKGLLNFTDNLIAWYDKKYPVFVKSPIRSEILELKEKVSAKYFGGTN